MNTQEIQEWENEFDEKFGLMNGANESYEDLKSFISQKLKEKNTEIEHLKYLLSQYE